MKLKSISQSFLFSTLVLLQSHSAFAEIITSVPEIGPHQKVLTVEKNRNPENILIVYTKTDAACNFTNDNLDQPVFDFYWLINGTDFKAMNTVLRSEVEKRMSVTAASKIQEKMFYVTLSDLNEVDHDIADPRLEVSAIVRNGVCDVQSLIRLGPSNQNALVRVESFYGESTSSLFNPKIILVTIKGYLVQTGQPVSRTYKARK